MENFINKVQTVIDSNAELKNSKTLRAVLESIKFENNMQFLTDLKEGLTDVNKYMDNEDLASIINSVDDKIKDERANDVDGYIKDCSNEFNVCDVCDKVKTDVPSEPSLVSCLDQIKCDCEQSGRPTYLYLNALRNILSQFASYGSVQDAINSIDDYTNNNQEKLCVLDTINYCDSMGGYGINPGAVETLKQCVVDNEYNPEVMAIKLGESINNSNIINMLSTLRGIRSEKSGKFELGQSDFNTKVYNYVGPCLREGKDVTFYVDNTFIKITPNKEDSSRVSRVVNEGEINIYEIKETSIFESNSKFYGLAKAFEALGFSLNSKGVSAKLLHSTVDFRVNENQQLDFYINNQKIDSITDAKCNEGLIIESQAAKSCLYTVLENTSSLFNMPFVKFMINEKRGAASMIFDINNEYYVYDFVSESKTDIYKLNPYKLYEFCYNKFNYDVAPMFEMNIKDVRRELSKIEENKQAILNKIEEYKASVEKIDKALYENIQEEDRKSLVDLKDVLFGGMNDLKSNYEELCKASDKIRFGKGDSISEGVIIKTSEEDGEQPTENTEDTTTEDMSPEEIEQSKNEEDPIDESQIVKCPECGKAHDKEEGCEEKTTEDDSKKKNNTINESITPTHVFENDGFKLGIKFSNDGSMAKVFEGSLISNWLPIEFGNNSKGEPSLIIDKSGYNICVEDVRSMNEGLLDAAKAVGSAIGNAVEKVGDSVTYMSDLKKLGLFGNIKVKNAMYKYTTELPKLIAERMKKELDIEVANQKGESVSQLESEVDDLKQKENIIRKEYKLRMNEIAKDGDKASAVERMKLKADKALLDALSPIKKSIFEDEKYKSLEAAKAKSKELEEAQQTINNKIESMEGEVTSNQGSSTLPKEGDKVELNNGETKTVKDVLVEVEGENGTTDTVNGSDVKPVK